MWLHCKGCGLVPLSILFVSSIGNQVIQVTTNVRLGFGSFNEKIIQPYAFIPLELTDPPFTLADDNFPYAFRHSVNLTDDNEEFSVSFN